MTYDLQESSIQDGEPVELYEFTVGLIVTRFTSYSIDYVHGGSTYQHVSLNRTEIEETSELERNDLTIRTARDFPIANLFRVSPPSYLVLLTIFRVHATDSSQEKKPFWSGRILNCSKEGVEAILTCENIFTSLKRPGLTRKYQRTCPYELYEGSTCKVSDTDYQELATVTSVDGLVVYSPDLLLFAVGYFDGGFMEWEVTPGVIEKRSIRFHVDDHIELTSPIIDLSGGVEIKLFPGCDHVMEGDCTIKFNNRPNFGGMPDIPKLNPFGSNSVFK